MKKDLAIRTFDIAALPRDSAPACIFHSYRGNQYCSHDFQKKLTENKIISSMSGKGS